MTPRSMAGQTLTEEKTADGIPSADVMVHRFGQKRKLVEFEAGYVNHTRYPIPDTRF